MDSDGCPLPAGIAISKTPAVQQLRAGDAAAFTIAVTNTGQAALQNVLVADLMAPDCDRQFASLAAGEQVSYGCTLLDVRADLSNIASVSGTRIGGDPVMASASAEVDVIEPAIGIELLPGAQTVASGIDFLLAIKVVNQGDAPLTGVSVSDGLVPDCNRVLGTLLPGQQASYACLGDGVNTSFTHTATVTGQPPVGGSVSASDSATVTVGASRPF